MTRLGVLGKISTAATICYCSRFKPVVSAQQIHANQYIYIIFMDINVVQNIYISKNMTLK